MPRDDLSIDIKMPPQQQLEQQDAAAVLDEFTNRTANLPAEIAFMQEEIAEKDRRMQECLAKIHAHDSKIQKWIKMNGSHVANPKEEEHRKIIRANFQEAEILQEEKCALAQKTEMVVEKHTRLLDGQIKGLIDRGEFPNDPDVPSVFRNPPEVPKARPAASAPSAPLGPVQNGVNMVHQRHPNQHPQRMIPAQIHAQQMATASASSAPTTPAASLLARQARESSLGAGANKRQRLTGGLGNLPSASSSLARHSSMTPGTPRAGTPSGVRAGSAGPRAHKSLKKVAPLGSRQSGVPRKGKPGKSGLSRVKRTGTKNSPSSTNDSELSDAETGSADEDEDRGSPRKDADGDEMMEDPDDADDKKYCTCHRVSFGDMVACDNETCKYEWFHWECVGITREPPGVWICPECTALAAESSRKEKDSKKLK